MQPRLELLIEVEVEQYRSCGGEYCSRIIFYSQLYEAKDGMLGLLFCIR